MTSVDLYDYHLPERLIAQRPAAKREDSRLMTMNRSTGAIGHQTFGAFPNLLCEGDLLVLNRTKVFPARLPARRATGAKLEVLLVHEREPGLWEAMVRGLGKMKKDERFYVGDGGAQLAGKLDGGLALVRFAPEVDVARLIERFGTVPLPPYIRRESGQADDADVDRYQTVFAKQSGSSAAPTAGLHFTGEILGALRRKGVFIAEVLLHTGPGTFRPVKTQAIEDHVMDAEYYEISPDVADAINAAKREGRRVVAVGSTVTRALETAAGDEGAAGRVTPGSGRTALYIAPGFVFRAVDALLTNFHLPRSTLLILVSAFAGRELVMKAYEAAIGAEYRFYSYGDAMFLE